MADELGAYRYDLLSFRHADNVFLIGVRGRAMALFHRFLPSSKNEGPRLVTTAAMSFYLEKMFEEARKVIIIVSPYIKMSTRICRILQEKKESGVEVKIIYREDFSHHDVATQLFKRKNLHAKCFLTENEILIGSMNLYDYSQVNNDEMAIYLTKTENEMLYSSIEKEVCKWCKPFPDSVPVAVKEKFDIWKGLEPGKKYERKNLGKYFSFVSDYIGGINKTKNGNIVLFMTSFSKYENEEKDGIIYYMGQNTGAPEQLLKYGNKDLYDSFAYGKGRIFLFKDDVFQGEYIICKEPYQEKGKWYFPLKPRVVR